VPGDQVGEEAGQGAGQHDPQHQAAHQSPDSPAALALRDEAGGVGDEDLHGGDAEASDQGGEEVGDEVLGEGEPEQAGHCEAHQEQHQPLVLHQVAERDREDDSQSVADLDEGDDQPGRLRREADRLGDDPHQGLCVVQVGHRRSDDDGEQDQESRGERGRRAFTCRGHRPFVRGAPTFRAASSSPSVAQLDRLSAVATRRRRRARRPAQDAMRLRRRSCFPSSERSGRRRGRVTGYQLDHPVGQLRTGTERRPDPSAP
jgi:hypothetical protein